LDLTVSAHIDHDTTLTAQRGTVPTSAPYAVVRIGGNSGRVDLYINAADLDRLIDTLTTARRELAD
jgi:hypothetical protein